MNDDAPVPFDWKRSARAGLTFRPVEDGDMWLLSRVYAWTHMQDLADTSLNEIQKAGLLLLQFRAQHAHFQQHYPQADRLVITGGGYEIGRLYLVRWPAEHGIIDLAVLPQYRRHGAGGMVLRDLMDEAAAAGKPLSVLLDKFDLAMRLYQRLGFAAAQDKGAHVLMRWTPDAGEDP